MTRLPTNAPVSFGQEKKPSRLMDRSLTVAGIALAGAAAFFPWYVFFNEDKFGIHVAAIDHTRDLPEVAPHNVMSVSPLAMTDRDGDAKKPELEFDPLVTATVPKQSDEKPAAKEETTEEQPFPAKAGFRLLHVANGRALIEDASGMYMVRVGSILPDKSRLAVLQQREGKWVIVTSTGAVYEPN